MAEVMSVCMPLCGLAAQASWPNSCNLNLYQDGQHSVGWHADNEALFQGKYQDCRIISLSLGQSRRFELMCGQDFHRLELSDGDLCTMEGMTQKWYKHRVPKESGRNVGPRINLTWRWIVQHHDCPCAEAPEAPEVPAKRKRTSCASVGGWSASHG
ncbi:Alkbh3 [Symbiodinium pilosum]|uniref:Alkbh3 protein n=1 Tax=Symbiodinium pilosum TaxID=2952 RepID=A0A812PQW8_SYMPI|nr:Alkbh3 [Symbiodinium pilosum]